MMTKGKVLTTEIVSMAGQVKYMKKSKLCRISKSWMIQHEEEISQIKEMESS